MSITKSKLQEVTLVGDTVTDTHELEGLLETSAHTHYHIVDEGTVKAIVNGGRDYEVTVDFDNSGTKKMFAGFAKLKKL